MNKLRENLSSFQEKKKGTVRMPFTYFNIKTMHTRSCTTICQIFSIQKSPGQSSIFIHNKYNMKLYNLQSGWEVLLTCS